HPWVLDLVKHPRVPHAAEFLERATQFARDRIVKKADAERPVPLWGEPTKRRPPDPQVDRVYIDGRSRKRLDQPLRTHPVLPRLVRVVADAEPDLDPERSLPGYWTSVHQLIPLFLRRQHGIPGLRERARHSTG